MSWPRSLKGLKKYCVAIIPKINHTPNAVGPLISKFYLQTKVLLGRGGGQVVSVLAYNSDNLSLDPTDAYSFFL